MWGLGGDSSLGLALSTRPGGSSSWFVEGARDIGSSGGVTALAWGVTVSLTFWFSSNER
jgi:hypothetical protein